MAQFVRHMTALLTQGWHRIELAETPSNERAAEIHAWLKDPTNPGRYTYWSASFDLSKKFTYVFDDPHTAFAFKMRWV